MPRGTPLTPEQLATLGELYAETGNASAVARVLGVEISTVTRQLARLGEQGRAKLQGESLVAGMMLGQTYLEEAVARLGEVFVAEDASGAAVDADAGNKLVAALARATATIAGLQRREEQRLQAALTRDKTRAEIAAIDSRTNELPPMEVLKALLSPAQIVELVQSLSGEQFTAAMALTGPKEALLPKGG